MVARVAPFLDGIHRDIARRFGRERLDTLLVLATIENGPKHGYDACEMSWVLDTNNVLKNSLVDMGGVVDKQYAMFEMAL